MLALAPPPVAQPWKELGNLSRVALCTDNPRSCAFLPPSRQPVEKQQELLRTVYNVVTRRGATELQSASRGVLRAVLTEQCVPSRAADNLCSFVEDEATFGKVRPAPSIPAATPG